MKTIGSVIRKKRVEKKLNLLDASKKLKISRSTLKRLEEDETQFISILSLIDISNNLDIDFFEMLNSYGCKLNTIDLNWVLKCGKSIVFNNNSLSRTKIKELITNNLELLGKEDALDIV